MKWSPKARGSQSEKGASQSSEMWFELLPKYKNVLVRC